MKTIKTLAEQDDEAMETEDEVEDTDDDMRVYEDDDDGLDK